MLRRTMLRGFLQGDVLAPLVFVLISCVPQALSQSPGNPTIVAQSSAIEGSTVNFTCSSIGGNPLPAVTWYRGNTIVDETYTTSTVGSVTVTTNNLQFTVYRNDSSIAYRCEVNNVNLGSPLTKTWLLTIYVQPGAPTISGPSVVTAGSFYTHTCVTSSGGNPMPALAWKLATQFLNNLGISSHVTTLSDNTYIVENNVTWVPVASDNGKTLSCEISHNETLGTSKLTDSIVMTVQVQPGAPTISGPSVVTAGSTYTHRCVTSSGGNPMPTLAWKLATQSLNTLGISNQVTTLGDNTYIVENNITWVPVASDNGKTLSCELSHNETLGTSKLTDSIVMTVQADCKSKCQVAGPPDQSESNTTVIIVVCVVIVFIIIVVVVIVVILKCRLAKKDPDDTYLDAIDDTYFDRQIDGQQNIVFDHRSLSVSSNSQSASGQPNVVFNNRSMSVTSNMSTRSPHPLPGQSQIHQVRLNSDYHLPTDNYSSQGSNASNQIHTSSNGTRNQNVLYDTPVSEESASSDDLKNKRLTYENPVNSEQSTINSNPNEQLSNNSVQHGNYINNEHNDSVPTPHSHDDGYISPSLDHDNTQENSYISLRGSADSHRYDTLNSESI